MRDSTKALNHAYIPPASHGPTLYHKNSDVEFELPNKPVTVKYRGEETVIHDKSESYKNEMRANAIVISSIEDTPTMTAKEQIEDLIKQYKEKVDSNNSDFDEMTRNIHILIMLNLRKDGGLAKDLQDVAELNIHVHQNKSRDLHNGNVKFYVGWGVGLVMIAASVVGAVAAYNGAKAVAKTANTVLQGAGGAKSIESVYDTRTEGERQWVAANMRIIQEKEGQHREDGKQSLNSQQSTIQKIGQHRQNEFQTKGAFVRNNY